MGARHSFHLQRDNLINNNSSSVALVEIIGYLNGEASLAEIRRAIGNNWSHRGKAGAKKELMVVMCTAATSGQGKTELCRQLTLCGDLADGIDGISIMLAIPISFNQFTTFCDRESQRSIDVALVWRILLAFGNDNIDQYTPEKNLPGLPELLNSIRKANCPNGCHVDSVGIVLMLDEVMKMCDTSDTLFKQVLNVATDLQQRQLYNSLPTFVFVTSLELAPVSHQLVTTSGRVLQTIPIPFLLDIDLESVASKIYGQFYAVLCEGRPPPDAAMLERYSNLKNLIKITVSIAGRHFRTLEDSTRAIYGRLVTPEQHDRAERAGKTHELFKPRQTKGLETTEDIFARKGAGVGMSLKEVFDRVVNAMEQGGIKREMYENAKNIFLQLINEPNKLMLEEDMYPLEAAKVLFIKYRDPIRTSLVTPRVSLPFLYLYPRADLNRHLAQPSSPIGAADIDSHRRREMHRKEILNSNFLRLPDPAPLADHVEMLLQNIGVELTRPFEELSSAFEGVMPLAELLTVAARLLLPSLRVFDVMDILPHSIFKPWGNESLSVSPFIKNANMTVHTYVSSSKDSPSQEVRDAVHQALDASCDSVYICQGDANMECIEHVSRLFSVCEKPVLCMCSMKFREKSDPARLAKQIHKFVKDNVPDLAGNLAGNIPCYYAVLYCCVPAANVDLGQLPPGTLIVPMEAVRHLLYPFGLNQLILNAEEKCARSKRV